MENTKLAYHIGTLENGIEQWVNEDGERMVMVDPTKVNITSKEQIEAFKRMQAIKHGRSKNWVACYHEAVKSLSSKLTLEEMGVVFLLLPHMNLRKKGELTLRGDRITVKDIAKTVGKSVSYMKKVLPKLVESGVLYKEREGKTMVYGITKEYHTIGKANKGEFTKLYQQFTVSLKDEYDLTIQLAGVLYAILPYFHYKTHLLCTNPNEDDAQALDPMGANELAEMLGVSLKTIYNHMNALALRGIIVKIGTFGTTIYRVNPDLTYRLEYEDEYTRTVRADFTEAMKLYKKQKAKKASK